MLRVSLDMSISRKECLCITVCVCIHMTFIQKKNIIHIEREKVKCVHVCVFLTLCGVIERGWTSVER